ncbi:tRNA uridine-5-carboxymethylaminomethyl(34) synthesis GTPase MnmE [uncultured Enterovirga sp.]|uniref:tRNA uridine-5-carboxymethylaminomethyl(34) synthesis GTPase MnmE n=1 Tax=uncultured Enterovirga sp. TaxID=2026352 RepID=UPI0035C97E02
MLPATPSDPETIYAVASGHGRSAIAVIRLSGSRTAAIVSALIGTGPPEPRRLSLRRIRSPESGEAIDQAMVVWLPGPSTFTGEDQAELQIHGGPAVKAALLRALSGQPRCRPAEPGEFTRRAFLNGRLDLTEVEGLADLIEAETEAQRKQALRQLEGKLASQVELWREGLIDALAWCEAGLDFTDEDDVPDDVADEATRSLLAIRDDVAAAVAAAGLGERLREGFTVVIAGPPNAGKSTLLNALARRDVAIVSPVAGTTRDAIEVRCDLGGLPVTLVDTAGLRDSENDVEREGIARAESRMASADLILWLTPVGDRTGIPDRAEPTRCSRVWTKSDLGQGVLQDDDGPVISAATGAGLPELLDLIKAEAVALMGSGDDALVTRERHRIALAEVVDCLDRALLLRQGQQSELVAEDLRLALRALGRMTGRVDVEEVLGRIFSAFCIGK